MSAEVVELTDRAGVSLGNFVECEDGTFIPPFQGDPETTLNNIKAITNMTLRPDDVLLYTYPKSGSHWGFEILSMLLQGSAERQHTQKMQLMLELHTVDKVEDMSSPRILNTHVPVQYLPKQLKEKKNKVIVVMRNPKDVAVSMFYQARGMILNDTEYKGNFSDFLATFMDGIVIYGSWFKNTLDCEKAISEGEFDMHLTFFEDLKENGVEEIRNIAKFLGIDVDDALCRAIYEACSFEKMKVEKAHPKEMIEKMFLPSFAFYRKGQTGDWKNHFTVAESEAFDVLFEKKLGTSILKSKFKFVPSTT